MSELKILREKRLITQEELAAASGLAVATVSRLERGKSKPSLKTIKRLAKALEVNPYDLRALLVQGQGLLEIGKTG